MPGQSPENQESPLSLAATNLLPGADGKWALIGGECAACGGRMFPRGPICPRCQSADVAVVELPRAGRIYAFSTIHAGPRQWIKPYTLGYVDLEDGVRVLAHLRGDAPVIDGKVTLGVGIVGANAEGRPIETFVFDVEGR